jgi:hypothetical protein
MKKLRFLILAVTIALISCEKKSNNNDSILINKVNYSGCFSSKKKLSTADDLKDSLYFTSRDATLVLFIDIVYPCCGELKDSVVINDNVVNIYLNDEHQDSYACNCICLFKIDYQISILNQQKTYFKVYTKNVGDNNFSLWKETTYLK